MSQPENKSATELEPDLYRSGSIEMRALHGQNRPKKYQLFINGVLIKNVEVETGGQAWPDGLWFSLRTDDEKAFARLGTLRQLPQRLNGNHIYCELHSLGKIVDGNFFFLLVPTKKKKKKKWSKIRSAK